MNIDVIVLPPFSQPILFIAPVFSTVSLAVVLITAGLALCQAYVRLHNEDPDSAASTWRRVVARPHTLLLIILIIISFISTAVVLTHSFSAQLMTTDSRVDQATQHTYGVTLASTGTRCQGNWVRCDQPGILVKNADGQIAKVSYIRTAEATAQGQPAVLLDETGHELPHVTSPR